MRIHWLQKFIKIN